MTTVRCKFCYDRRGGCLHCPPPEYFKPLLCRYWDRGDAFFRLFTQKLIQADAIQLRAFITRTEERIYRKPFIKRISWTVVPSAFRSHIQYLYELAEKRAAIVPHTADDYPQRVLAMMNLTFTTAYQKPTLNRLRQWPKTLTIPPSVPQELIALLRFEFDGNVDIHYDNPRTAALAKLGRFLFLESKINFYLELAGITA